MKDAPLVSVIMPTYNSAEFIGAAIQSVQNQTYLNWELFVIDDASTDATFALVEDFISLDSRIKLFQNAKNAGAGASRNTGIKAAKGSFIAFLDADDLWMPEKLVVQVNFMLKNNLAMSFSSYRLMTETGQLLPEIVESLPELSYKKLLRSNYIGNLTGMYNADKIGKIYSPLLRKRQDWGLWLSILEKAGSALGIQQPLAYYRLRKNSISNNKTALLKYNFQIYNRVLDYSFLKSCKYMSRFLWEHFMVKNKQVKTLNK
ncbi:MAG TPA: glycosyltransferase family 2 protein [Gillisia sp.]|nr:glycosyltransferase family 2 protein [Gillisia sp.]